MKMNILDKLVWLLLIIGAFNWGLVGWLNFNLVNKVFGVGAVPARVIYAVFGAGSLYALYRAIELMSTSNKTA